MRGVDSGANVECVFLNALVHVLSMRFWDGQHIHRLGDPR